MEIGAPLAPAVWKINSMRQCWRAGAALVLAFAGLGVGGCASVARKVIQGTDHGAAQAVVASGPRHEILRLQTRDGTSIAAQFGVAADRDGRGLADASSRPTVMYFYAGGHTLQRSAGTIERLRRLGVNVIVPEYPGFGMSGGEPTEAGCYAAADAVYEYLLSRPDVDRRRLVAAGWSVGGAVAVDLASRRPVAGLILVGTSTRMGDVARHIVAGQAPWSWVPGPVLDLLVRRCRLDSVHKVPAVRCPILLVTGAADELVPAEMADRLATAAKTRVTRYVVPGARHAAILSAADEGLDRALTDWLAVELSAAGGAAR